MTRSDPADGGFESGADHPQDSDRRQSSLDEVVRSSQCTAIATSTGERCQHSAIPGLPYCHDHVDLADLDGDGLQ